MPPATGVVDAFKSALLNVAHALLLILLIDLIRHGKHHRNVNRQAPVDSHDLRQPQDVSNTITHRAARIVVDEERKEQSTMPTYEGLEDFELEDKMGEYVFRRLSIIASLISVSSSGAFSNVFKALEKSTGNRVASMVPILSLTSYSTVLF